MANEAKAQLLVGARDLGFRTGRRGPFRAVVDENDVTVWQCAHRHDSIDRAYDCAAKEIARRG